MRQQHFFTTVSGEAELLHDFRLLRLGHDGAIKVCAFSVAIALELLEPFLVMEPLVCQEFAAIHASDRNNHLLLPAAIRLACVKFGPSASSDLSKENDFGARWKWS